MGSIAVRMNHVIRQHSTRKGLMLRVYEFDVDAGTRQLAHTYYFDTGVPGKLFVFSDAVDDRQFAAWWNSKSIYGGDLGLNSLYPLLVETLNSPFNWYMGGGTDWWNLDIYITRDGKVYAA